MPTSSLRWSTALALLGAVFAPAQVRRTAGPVTPLPVTEGSLIRLDPYGKNTGELCPLKHTSVDAEISGFLSRVRVTQKFQNTSGQKIEAIYAFPLPSSAAVDAMVMKVGDRTIKAVIKKREEAKAIFDKAREQGHVAALLEQERPNLFTQSVTNIEPGAQVEVTISYVETLKYEAGAYEFSFPMVAGPRYIPGLPTGKQGPGWSPDTTQVPDASRVTPKYAPPATRAGHDLSLKVTLDAGLPIDSLRSSTHEIASERPASSRAVITLARKTTIPNKDFVLRYDVAGAKVQDAVLTHRAERGGFFTLILQPPDRVTAEDTTPKELVFVLDTSGSMMGFPIEKAKEAMRLALAGLYPRDTFNLITFAGDTHVLFPKPVPATPENLQQAQAFLATRRGGGGTEMMKAIHAALAPSGDPEKVRIVCFMTDGYVGNEFEILNEIKRNPGARIFSFGIGDSVNRYLLDKMADEGRGEVEYVGLNDDGSAAARRFHERVRNPLLTDIAVEYAGLAVDNVYPKRIPDLFSAKPVIVHGRYDRAGNGLIRLRGKMSGKPFLREIRVALPERETAHDSLASLWARTRIDDLMAQDYIGMQRGLMSAPVKEEITQLGLKYNLMSQFTSFVAVEEKVVTKGGKPVVTEVPVEMPHGVSHEGVFGEAMAQGAMARNLSAVRSAAVVSGVPGGAPGGVIGGIVSSPAPVPRLSETVSVETHRQKISKLESSLAALLDGRDAGAPKRVAVEIWLTDASEAVLARLKALGFVETANPLVAKIRVGTIDVAQLKALEAMAEVISVSPHKSK